MNITNCEDLPLEALVSFLNTYRERFPDAKLMAPEFYLFHPAIEAGQNAYTVRDNKGKVLAFAPLFPAPASAESPESHPHHIWTILLADPYLTDGRSIRDALLDRVLAAARQIAAGFPSGRPTRLSSDLMASQRPEIEHLLARGFENYDGMYVLQRDLEGLLPVSSLPDDLELRRWKIETDVEQRDYLAAFNRNYPEAPRTLESYQYLFASPQWQNGTAVSAFDSGGALVGSVLAYPDKAGQWGITDDVFVAPELRGRGIARTLLLEALQFMAGQGLQGSRLEVMRSNHVARHLYESVGFHRVNEEIFLGRIL